MPDGMKMDVDTRRIRQIAREMPGGVDDLLAGAANEMVVDMQMSMDDSPRDGRTYTRGSVTHVASSPGNPPRPDTAALRNSLSHEATGKHEQTIYDQVKYGALQEFGTEDIEARPWMKPVFEDWRRRKFNEFVRKFGLVN